MDKVFEVELGGRNGLYAELTLPAAPYAMLDALERLRLESSETPRWELLNSFEVGRIFQHLDQADGSLNELNALAQRLARLDESELTIFEGLAAMEHKPLGQPFPLPRLIDMAYSTDRCHLVEGVVTDTQLGRFCAENGFVPEVDNLSDEAFELLDFERIGREFREAEGGVFTRGGYVQRHDELRQIYETLDLMPKKPDYIILVETASGGQVKLPIPVGKTMVDEPAQCVDCAAPGLAGLSGTMGTLDVLAHRLAELEMYGELPKYKAVLEAIGCDDDICRALSLADELDQYAFDPKLLEPDEVAGVKLDQLLGDDMVKLLLPHVKLCAFGDALIQAGGGKLTEYGLIGRYDREPIQSIDQEPRQGMMEAMQ